MCLDIVFEWGTAGCEDLKVTRAVGHFDGAVMWSFAASVLQDPGLIRTLRYVCT